MPDPVADEFRIMSDELTFGVSFEEALRHLMARVSTPDVRFFATALMIQKETGGNLSEVLDGLQKTIRERFRILGQVKTLTAQGKLSGLIVGGLPIVLCVFIYFANPGYMHPLFSQRMGHWMLGTGVGLQVLGVLMINKIVRIKV
jgi:tight adherence protein B